MTNMSTFLLGAWALTAGLTVATAVEARADGEGIGAYLNDLEDAGISDNSGRLGDLGPTVCHWMRSGWEAYSAALVVQGRGYTPTESRIIVATAGRTLCPDVKMNFVMPTP
jgi:Protein of unknown function (DUF732)